MVSTDGFCLRKLWLFCRFLEVKAIFFTLKNNIMIVTKFIKEAMGLWTPVYHLSKILSPVFGFKFTYNNLKTLLSVLIFLQLLSVAEECHTIFFLFLFSIFRLYQFHQRFSCHLCQAIVIFQHFLGTGSPCKGD